MYATETVGMDFLPGLVKSKTIKIGVHSFAARLSALKETLRSFRRL